MNLEPAQLNLRIPFSFQVSYRQRLSVCQEVEIAVLQSEALSLKKVSDRHRNVSE
ncbi:hypothetical protein Bbelb_311660, partial [Branchiostoma belcheri]